LPIDKAHRLYNSLLLPHKPLSREPPGWVPPEGGGSAPNMKNPPFPLRIIWCQNWIPRYETKGDKLIFRGPFTIAVYGNRKLQTPISPLFEELVRNGWKSTILKSQWVRLNGHNFGTRSPIWTMFGANRR